jgi:hypothetical protein
MRHRSIGSVAPLMAAVAILAATCQAGAPSSPAITTASPTHDVVAVPSGTPGPTVASSAPAAVLPAATLAAEGGDPVAGQLGSFTWLDGGSDSPWLPGAPISVGSGEPLTISLGDGAAVDSWTARRVAAGTTDGAAAVLLGEGRAPMAFRAPASGTWSTQVTIRFSGGLGDAAYYWRIDVR